MVLEMSRIEIGHKIVMAVGLASSVRKYRHKGDQRGRFSYDSLKGIVHIFLTKRKQLLGSSVYGNQENGLDLFKLLILV